MAQSLARALEGITFPCDRAQLIEYARTNKASSKALSALEAVPHRSFNSMTDVLAAVPSKTEMRRRPMAAEPPGVKMAAEPSDVKMAPEPPGVNESPEAPSMQAAQPVKEALEPVAEMAEPVEEAVEASLQDMAETFPFMIQPPDFGNQSAWLKLGAEWGASYLRTWRRLWSTWLS